MRWGVQQEVGSKEPHAGHGGAGQDRLEDDRHRRSGVERGEQIVLAMLAGVGAGAAGRWHHPVSLQPVERPGDLDDGHVEVLAPAQICAVAQGMATCQRLSIDLGRFAGVTLTDALDRSAGGEPVHCGHVGGWFPGEDGLAVVHGEEHVRLALNSFLVS